MRGLKIPVAITVAASAAVVLGASRATPPVLFPGSPDVTTGHLVAASARYRYLARAAGETAEREMSTGHAEQVVTSYKGKPALLLVKSSARGGQTTFMDSALVMHAGLAP